MKKAVVAGLQGAVASCAGHPFVTPFECEAAVPVVVEFLGQPVHGHVTTLAGYGLAVGGRLIGEQAPVHILVATGAMPGRPAEGYLGPCPLVAGQTVDRGVPAVQCKSGHSVIEGCRPPAFLGMAGFAALFRSVFFGLPPMGVLMAGRAGSMIGEKFDRRRVRSHAEGTVASITRGGSVRTAQWKDRFGMPGQGKPCGPESLDGVAILAARQAGFCEGLAAVGVAVTVTAGGELRFFSIPGVAGGTGHRGVPAEQRVTGPRMIEGVPLDQQPTRGGMALATVGTQCPGVEITVAIRAGGVGQTRKDQAQWFTGAITGGHMTLGAIDSLVLAVQGEGCLVVNKKRRGPPPVRVVAIGADAGGVRLPVHIRMAGSAGRIQTQIGAAQVLVLRLEAACVDDVFGIVALPAIEFGVPARHLEADGPVVETLPAVRPVDQIVILAMVFNVTVNAVAEILPRMHPGTAPPHGRDFLVTIQAFFEYLTAAELVAGGAFFQTAEVGVGTTQRPGRQLGPNRIVAAENQNYRADYPCQHPGCPRSRSVKMVSAARHHELPNSHV